MYNSGQQVRTACAVGWCGGVRYLVPESLRNVGSLEICGAIPGTTLANAAWVRSGSLLVCSLSLLPQTAAAGAGASTSAAAASPPPTHPLAAPRLFAQNLNFEGSDYSLVDTLFSLAEAYLFMQLVELKDSDAGQALHHKTYSQIYKVRRPALPP